MREKGASDRAASRFVDHLNASWPKQLRGLSVRCHHFPQSVNTVVPFATLPYRKQQEMVQCDLR